MEVAVEATFFLFVKLRMEKMFSVVVGSQPNKFLKDREDKFYHLCKNIALEHSLDIYDLDYFKGNSILRVYIFNPCTGTATIDDCILVNRSLEALLEKKDWLPSTTTLEVSSPGIGRRLSRQFHFMDVLEKDIVIVLKDAVAWANKGEKIIVKVLAVKEREIQLKWKEQTISLPWENIKKANLREEIRV